MEKIFKNRFLHLCLKIIGIAVISFSFWLLLMNLIYGDQLNLKGLYKKLGTIGEFGSIAAASLWFLRHIWLFLKKKKLYGFKIVKELYMLMKKFHVLIGYAILAAATTHGLYFFIKGSRHISQTYSGIFTFISLALLGLVGILLHKFSNKTNWSLYRKFHQTIAVIFGVGLLIHLMV